MMLPIIADTNFEKLCILDDYSTFIWTSRYYSPGDFELCVPVNDRSREAIRKGYYVFRDDSNDVGIIERIEIQNNADGAELFIAKGRFASSILGRRIISTQTQLNNKTIDAACATLIDQEIINPEIPERAIRNFSVDHTYTTQKKITIQITGKNLLEAIEKICESNGIGFRVGIENGDFVFSMYEGTDRSYGQSVNPYVVFSDKYDNLLSSEYWENYQDMITDVLIAGEGEGLDRKTLWVTREGLSGLERYEYYQDARNMSTNDGEIPEAEYYEQLHAEGLESITSYTAAFSGEVDFAGVRYGVDVFLGDICTVENSRWGIRMNSRLVEVMEAIDEAGAYTITPTFGV